MRPRIVIRRQELQQRFALLHPHDQTGKEAAVIDLTMDEIKVESTSNNNSRIIVNNEVSVLEESRSVRCPACSVAQITSTIRIPTSIALSRISKRTLQVQARIRLWMDEKLHRILIAIRSDMEKLLSNHRLHERHTNVAEQFHRLHCHVSSVQ